MGLAFNWGSLATVGAGAVGTAIGGPGVGAAFAGGASALTSTGGAGAAAGQADARGRNWCPGRPTDAEIDIVRRSATPNELAQVVQHWNSAGKDREFGPFDRVAPYEIGYWLMGHRDCRHSDPNGAAVQNTFLQLVRKYAGNTNPIAPAQGPSAIQTAGQAIKQGTVDFVTGVAGGAAGGAATAAQTGGAAAQASQQLTQLLPLLLVLGLAAVIILKK